MINLTHMISILNFVFTIVFYTVRWTKLDLFAYVLKNLWTKLDHAYICFEEFLNRLNLFYIYICLYLQQDKCYEMHELDRGPKFSARPSLAQWVDFLYYSMFLILMLFYLYIFNLCLFWTKKTDHHSTILNFIIQSHITARVTN
jgi:hypothetical protein